MIRWLPLVVSALLLSSAAHAASPPALSYEVLSIDLRPKRVVVVAASEAVANEPAAETIVRYAVVGPATSNVLAANEPFVGRGDVRDDAIEDAVARFEDAGIPARDLSIERIRPFDLRGAPLSTAAVVTVHLPSPRAEIVRSVYAAHTASADFTTYLDTWERSTDCAQLRRTARRRAVQTAGDRAEDALRQLGAHSRQRVVRVDDPPAVALSSNTGGSDNVECSGAAPPVPLTAANVTPLAPLAVAELRADAVVETEASDALRPFTRGVAIPDGLVEVPDFDEGDSPELPIRESVPSNMRVAQFSAAITLANTKPDAWLLSFSLNIAPAGDIAAELVRSLGIRPHDVLTLTQPGIPWVRTYARLSDLTRDQMFALVSQLHAAAEKAATSVATVHVVAFSRSCDRVNRAAQALAIDRAQAGAERFSRATLVPLAGIRSAVITYSTTSIVCGTVPPTVQGLVEAVSPSDDLGDDVPGTVGTSRATVQVTYEIH